MTKPKPRPKRAVDAVTASLRRETEKRPDGLKPREIVKIAICAYQHHVNEEALEPSVSAEMDVLGMCGVGTLVGRDYLLDDASLDDERRGGFVVVFSMA